MKHSGVTLHTTCSKWFRCVCSIHKFEMVRKFWLDTSGTEYSFFDGKSLKDEDLHMKMHDVMWKLICISM